MEKVLFQSELKISGVEKIALLENISRFGSIAKAAKVMNMSYRSAWDAIKVMNLSSFGPLIVATSGGKTGGGAELTPVGQNILSTYQRIAIEHSRFIKSINEFKDDLTTLEVFMRRISMKTSARNQFFGIVTQIKKGAVNAEVELKLNGGDLLVATVTNKSLKDLKIRKNGEAWAIFKASWVILGQGEEIILSARNKLTGVIGQIQKGAIHSEIGLILKGGNEVTAIITNESLKNLKLKKGSKACAYIKASHIILGVNS